MLSPTLFAIRLPTKGNGGRVTGGLPVAGLSKGLLSWIASLGRHDRGPNASNTGEQP